MIMIREGRKRRFAYYNCDIGVFTLSYSTLLSLGTTGERGGKSLCCFFLGMVTLFDWS